MGESMVEPDTERLIEAAGATIDDDDDQWRRLSGDNGRDLSPLTQARMVELAAYLWETNLLADRMIELPVAYLLAEGVQLTATDAEDQAVLSGFWGHPLNRMDLRLEAMVRELALFGEQVYPVLVNPVNGAVRLTSIDPALIETVVTDPDDRSTPIGLVLVRDRKGVSRRLRIIYNGPETLFSPRTRTIRETFTDGECFYYAIRRLSGGRRGRSDLLAAADWLDGYDKFLFGEMDRADFLRAFVWDVTLKGANEDAVKARARQIVPPRPGGVRVHNEAEEWQAVSPELSSADVAGSARLLRNHVLGGATIPEHWYGGGGDVNRATAGEMGDPTYKVLSRRQRLWKAILEEIGTYVLRARYGALTHSEDYDFGVEAVFPELTASDTTKYATALVQVAQAAAMLVDRGLWTELRALQAVEAIAGRLGMDVDAAELLADARKEAGKRAEDDVFTTPGDA